VLIVTTLGLVVLGFFTVNLYEKRLRSNEVIALASRGFSLLHANGVEQVEAILVEAQRVAAGGVSDEAAEELERLGRDLNEVRNRLKAAEIELAAANANATRYVELIELCKALLTGKNEPRGREQAARLFAEAEQLRTRAGGLAASPEVRRLQDDVRDIERVKRLNELYRDSRRTYLDDAGRRRVSERYLTYFRSAGLLVEGQAPADASKLILNRTLSKDAFASAIDNWLLLLPESTDRLWLHLPVADVWWGMARLVLSVDDRFARQPLEQRLLDIVTGTAAGTDSAQLYTWIKDGRVGGPEWATKRASLVLACKTLRPGLLALLVDFAAQRGDRQLAGEVAWQAWWSHPADPSVLSIHIAQFRWEANMADAIAFQRVLVSTDPSNPVYWHNLGLDYEAFYRFDSAFFAYDTAIRLGALPVTYLNRGTLWRSGGRLDKAINDLTKVTKEAPREVLLKARQALGLVFLESGRFRDAATEFKLFEESGMRLGPMHDQQRCLSLADLEPELANIVAGKLKADDAAAIRLHAQLCVRTDHFTTAAVLYDRLFANHAKAVDWTEGDRYMAAVSALRSGRYGDRDSPANPKVWHARSSTWATADIDHLEQLLKRPESREAATAWLRSYRRNDYYFSVLRVDDLSKDLSGDEKKAWTALAARIDAILADR